MTTIAPWAPVLEGEELAYLGTEGPGAAVRSRFPTISTHVSRRRWSPRGSRRCRATRRRRGGRPGGRQPHRHDGHGERQEPRVQPPVLDLLARDPKSRALYLYPTKALAQDQARALGAFALKGVKPAIYDGDTETERRWQIRKWANVILTNPDMLHVGVLPHHDRWGDVLANLRFVVVDEAHVYRGVFGSHVANVLRGLRRLAAGVRSEPQFVLASATIANPGELAESLLGEPATVVDGDAAPEPSGRSRSGTRSSSMPSSASGRARSATLAAARRLQLAGPPHDLLREEPEGGGADPSVHGRPGGAATAERLAPYAPGTRRRSGGRSSGG